MPRRSLLILCGFFSLALPRLAWGGPVSLPLSLWSTAAGDSNAIDWLDATQLATGSDSFTVEPGQLRFVLSTSHLVDPVNVSWNGQPLRALQDFELDRARGVVVLLHPRAKAGILRVEYHFDPVAAPPRVQLHPMLRQAELGEEPEGEGTPGSGTQATEGFAEAATASSPGLSVSGSKTVSVQGGTNRDATVDQGLHLAVNGQLTDNTFVRAEISDENLPITPEGNTEQLKDIDQVRIEIYGSGGRALLGDFEIDQPLGVYVPYQRKLQGLWLHGRQSIGSATLMGGSPRGRRVELELRGQEGVQGPYELLNGLRETESFIIAGSERVWLDGARQTRGENRDYTIDYVRGTITFTELRPIGPENRIAVDFEVSATGYSRTVLGAAADSLSLGPTSFHLSWILEADDPDRPIGGPLSDEDEQVLREAGDNPNRALGSGVTRVAAGEEGTGDYLKRTQGGTEYYVFAPGDSLANYFLSFQRVEANQGDYTQSEITKKGQRVYEYVGPGKGEFVLGRRLSLPSKSEAIVVGTTLGQRGNAKGFLAAEADMTRRDENVLSPLDDGNNDGVAWRVEGASPWIFGGGEPSGVRIRGLAEGIGPEFYEFGRIRAPFFYDAWNLQDNPRAQHEGRELAALTARAAERETDASVERLHRHGSFQGTRARWTADGRLIGPLEWQHDLAFMSHRGESGSTGHRRNRSARLGVDLGRFEPFVRLRDERYDEGPARQKQGYQDQEWGVGVLSRNRIASGRFEFRRLLADSLSTEGSSWRFQQDLREWRAAAEGLEGAFRWNLDGTWRESDLDGGQKESTRLARIGLGFRPTDRLFGADLDYRAGNDRSRVIQRTTIFVGEGQGDYDQEGNRIGRNLGDYNVVFSPSDSLIAATDVELAAKVDAEWRDAPLVKGISFNGLYKVSERSRSEDVGGVLRLKPSLLRQPDTTIFGEEHVRGDFVLLRRVRNTELRLTFDQTTQLDRRYTVTPEASVRRERSFRIDRELTRGFNLRLDGGNRQRERTADPNASSFLNSYQVDDLYAGLLLGYRATARTRASLEGRGTRRRDGFSSISQKVLEFVPSVTSDFLRARWTVSYRWAEVNESGGDPLLRPFFFERPGSNQRLATVAQWTLGKSLSLTFRYQLRDEPQRKMVQDLSVETRARF